MRKTARLAKMACESLLLHSLGCANSHVRFIGNSARISGVGSLWGRCGERKPEELKIRSPNSIAYNLSAQFATMKSQPIREIL